MRTFTVNKTHYLNSKCYLNIDIMCLSSDEKPTVISGADGEKDIWNGSTLYEMDTHKLYLFDAENLTWIEQ